ncbi:MAG TPA: hypothetical protein VGO62_13730, partial [Myxococcota bacterium]
PHSWPPAPGQGAVAVEARTGDQRVQKLLAPLEHAETRRAAHIERSFLRVLEGGCTTPFGCYVDEDDAHAGREMLAAGQQAGQGYWSGATIHLPDNVDDAFITKALTMLHRDPERTDDHHRLWRAYRS